MTAYDRPGYKYATVGGQGILTQAMEEEMNGDDLEDEDTEDDLDDEDEEDDEESDDE